MNHKPIQRLWCEEGLRRPVRTRKRRRVAGVTERLRLSGRTSLAIDFQFDETADGPAAEVANIVDERTREALARRVARTCGAHDLVTVLTELAAAGGAYAPADQQRSRADRLSSTLLAPNHSDRRLERVEE